MEFIEFIQKSFLFLLPGIIGSYIYSKLNIQKEVHYYLKFLEIIVISFFSFLITNILFGIVIRICPGSKVASIDIVSLISDSTSSIPTASISMSIVSSIAIACLLTKMEYENWLFKIANRLELTRRIDNQTVWEHIFDDSKVVILRDTITKNIYYGEVFSYSDNSENREICFEDVKVYNEDADFLYHADMLYLSRSHNEFTVEIQKESLLDEEEQ